MLGFLFGGTAREKLAPEIASVIDMLQVDPNSWHFNEEPFRGGCACHPNGVKITRRYIGAALGGVSSVFDIDGVFVNEKDIGKPYFTAFKTSRLNALHIKLAAEAATI